VRKISIGSLVKRWWVVLIAVAVVGVAGFAVVRLHGVFGSHYSTSAGSAFANEIVPFNPKHVVLDVFGPPGAVASFKMRSNEPDYAKVIEVTPLTKAIKTARQSCHDETVTHQVKPRDSNQVIGTVAGAVLGGVIGHQIGGGSGRDIATVAGAAAGGYGGNRIEKHMQDKNTYTTTEPRCETVYDKSEKQVGYSVRYRLGNQERTIKMNHDPGDRIPVHDGQLVLDDSPGTQDKKS